MNYPSIRIEGAIFSPQVLDQRDDAASQHPAALQPSPLWSPAKKKCEKRVDSNLD